jgi:hypothetical protein
MIASTDRDTARVVPPAVRLTPTFDVARMVAEVEQLRPDTWKRQNYIDEQGQIREAWVDWRCLPLRSIGGDPSRTDPGAPGLVDFAYTRWYEQAPYLAEVLASIPAPIFAVRLLALAGGVEGPEHNDIKFDLRWGLARLHVPITTSPGAVLYLDKQPFRWQPGTLWFGDFNRFHKVENVDTALRIHMVFDVAVSPGLLELFPADYREVRGAEVIVNRAPVPQSADERRALRVRFALPASFVSEEEVDGNFLQPQEQRSAVIDDDGSRLVLSVDGEPKIALVHVGNGELRYMCWTDERSIQVSARGDYVTLRSRAGTQVRELELPAERLA